MISINTSIPCNKGNYTVNNSRNIRYIVIHYTGNSKDTAIANAKYFSNNSNCQASAHYFVDDNEIYQSVKDKDRAWHCGTKKSYYHAECRNNNAIGIEMCCTAGNYRVSEKTKQNTAQLCAMLCKKYNITIDRVVRHYDITHKNCPAQMSGDNNTEWVQFKNLIQSLIEEEEDMTQETFNKMMDKYITELAQKPASFDQNALVWAQKNGLIMGDETGNLMAKKFMTRGEFAVVLQRFFEKFGNKT